MISTPNTLTFCVALSLLTMPGPATAQSREAMDRDYQHGVIYVVTTSEVVFAEPNPSSKKLTTLDPGGWGLLIFRTVPGWIQIGIPNSETFDRGWIKGSAENIITGNQLTIPMRRQAMEGKDWPVPIRTDILRGRVRIGFTKEQVQIAKGHAFDQEPTKVSEETAAGLTEIWTYPDAVYTFTGGKVSKITKVE